MDIVPSNPSVTETLQLSEEAGPRSIAFHIDPSLVRRDGLLYTGAMTPYEGRQIALILLDKAVDAERIAATRGRP